MCKEYNRCHKIVFGAVIVSVDLHNRIVFGVVSWLCSGWGGYAGELIMLGMRCGNKHTGGPWLSASFMVLAIPFRFQKCRFGCCVMVFGE
jgi:hypothetical protein